MHDRPDIQLLRDYAATGSEAAFRELVTRHTDFVFSAALRQVGSPDLAADLAQGVFTDLARKARSVAEKMPPQSSLAGWLHRSTRYAALNHLRDTRRRQSNERQAMEQLLTNTGSAPDWELIRPVLDEALDSLADEDREALLLRYFKNQDFRAIGLVLGTSDDTAQKRVTRAVDRLRDYFTRRNVTIGASGLVVLISANVIQAAPAGLAAAITTTALAGTAASTATIIATTKTIAMTTFQKFAITATVAALAGAGIYEAVQAQKLRAVNQSLQKQMDQMTVENRRLTKDLSGSEMLKPMPVVASVPVLTNQPAVAITTPANFWTDLTNRSATVKLTHDQAEAFLSANGRTAVNLLAAFRTTRDASLLEEAMGKFPNDPQVAFEATQGTVTGSLHLSPAEQRQWLDNFEKNAPKNSLANYLSAADYFNNGDIEHGVQELAAGSGKSLDDYNASRAESDIEAYQSAGYSLAESTQFGTSQLMLPQLLQLKSLTQETAQLAAAYRQSGDTAAAQNVLQLADTLGRQYAAPVPGEPTISQLVGIAIEKIALNSMDPNAPYGDNGQTVQDRLNQLTQQRTQLVQLNQQTESLLPSLTPEDLITYKNRWLMLGEANAEQWIVDKYGHQ